MTVLKLSRAVESETAVVVFPVLLGVVSVVSMVPVFSEEVSLELLQADKLKSTRKKSEALLDEIGDSWPVFLFCIKLNPVEALLISEILALVN